MTYDTDMKKNTYTNFIGSSITDKLNTIGKLLIKYSPFLNNDIDEVIGAEGGLLLLEIANYINMDSDILETLERRFSDDVNSDF